MKRINKEPNRPGEKRVRAEKVKVKRREHKPLRGFRGWGAAGVLKADTAFEELARNKLPDKVLASIAVSDGDLFIRGYKNLWCLGTK